MTEVTAWVIALPLLGALGTVLWPAQAARLGLTTAGLTAVAAGALVWRVAVAGPVVSALGGWEVPLGIALRADGLSALFVALTGVVGLAVSAYAVGYFRGSAAGPAYWPLWLVLWGCLNALFLAGDLFNLYVTLELAGLAAVALTALGAGTVATRAALRYLLVGLVGALAYLLGVTLVYTAFGSLDVASVRAAIGPTPAVWAALALMTGGIALKTALFPFHFWLPPAHANAPAPVSAALSALVVKAAFYLLLRLWLDLFGPVLTPASAQLMGALGAAAVLWGSWRALRAERLKVLAAYSTVAQVGYLVLFLPLLAAAERDDQLATILGGAVLLALGHGLAKAALFLAAGLVQRQAGNDRVDALDGTAQRLPATTFTLALAGAALVGLPPGGGFLGKWTLLGAAIELGQWWWAPVVAVGTLLSAGYVFRLLGHAFGHDPAASEAPVSVRAAEVPALVLAGLATVALGLGSAPVWELAARGVLAAPLASL